MSTIDPRQLAGVVGGFTQTDRDNYARGKFWGTEAGVSAKAAQRNGIAYMNLGRAQGGVVRPPMPLIFR
jgi:hypothetical protein